MNEEIQTINLSDYIQTGEGGTALTYTHKNGQSLAKLYNPGFEADRAKAEFLTARTVFELGIPSPRPIRMITDGQRGGAEYELIKNKRSYTRIISQEPQRLEEISLRFARMAHELHAKPADTTRLHSYKQRLERFYRETDKVPDDYRQQALKFLDTVPDTPRCIHGDLHIGNIITDGERTLWIDIGQFAYGAPEWDMSLCWRIAQIQDPNMTDRLFHLTPEQMRRHWAILAPAYYGCSSEELGAVIRKLLPYSVIKSAYMYHLTYHRPIEEEKAQKICAALQ
jgi:uncharacterized protein (TIGR02172 family)